MSGQAAENKLPNFRKVMRIGTMKTWGGRSASIFIEVTTERNYFSVTGVIGPLPSGNALGGCGQIDMEFAHRNPVDNDERYSTHLVTPDQISFAKGWSADKWFDLLDIWQKWHLNDMHELVVPDSVISQVMAFPDADRAPAWV